MFNIGLLGAGAMAWKHASVLNDIDGISLAGVSGASSASRDRLAKAFGVPAFATAEALISDPRIDVVDICLPTFLHAEYVCKAATAGKHVVCEKPLALTRSEAQVMAAAVQAAGIHFMVAQVVRFWPEYVAIKRLLNDGVLGRPLAVYAARLHDNGQAAWMRDPEKGGGAALDLHIHDLDFLYTLFGVPQSVHAVGQKIESGVWDHVYTTLQYDTVQAVAEASYLLPRGWPFTTEFRLVGDAAAVTYRAVAAMGGREPSAELILYRPGLPPERLTCPPADPYQAQLAYFVDLLRQDKPPGAQIEEALQVLDIALAVQSSLAEGTVVPFIPKSNDKEIAL